MAKKTKKPTPNFVVEFDGAFSVTIKPAAAAAAMRKAVESPNQAIGLQIAGVDDCIHMLSLYPADEPKGLVTLQVGR